MKGNATYGATIVFVSFELVTENSEGAVLDALVSDLKIIPRDADDLRTALVELLNDTPVCLS